MTDRFSNASVRRTCRSLGNDRLDHLTGLGLREGLASHVFDLPNINVCYEPFEAPMRLGIILPDAGADQSEWLRLGLWFIGRGVYGVDSCVELSPSDGRHEREALHDTANTKHLVRAARSLSQKHCDAIVWACTSGSFIGGRPMAESQNAAITQATQIPATNASLALAAAAEALDADRVDVLSPYPQSVTEVFLTFLREMNIKTVRSKYLGCCDGQASSELHLHTVLSEFQRSGRNSSAPNTNSGHSDQQSRSC